VVASSSPRPSPPLTRRRGGSPIGPCQVRALMTTLDVKKKAVLFDGKDQVEKAA